MYFTISGNSFASSNISSAERLAPSPVFLNASASFFCLEIISSILSFKVSSDSAKVLNFLLAFSASFPASFTASLIASITLLVSAPGMLFNASLNSSIPLTYSLLRDSKTFSVSCPFFARSSRYCLAVAN